MARVAPPARKIDAEEVKVGGYQIVTLLLLSANFVIVAMSHALTLFYKYTPKFYCQEQTWQQEAVASPQLVTANEVVVRHQNRTYGCLAFGCPGRYLFEPGEDEHRRSVATEWQLVCERERLLRAGSELYFAGLLLGAVIAGLVADRIGRLPVLAICLYAQGTMAVALNVVQDYKLFLVFRALQGVFVQGLESCSFVLCMELFPAKSRTLVALAVLSMRSVGLVLVSGLSYAVPDWRILQLVVSVPTAATVLYIWMLPESPRWLLAKGKSTEADLLLERIANYNRLFCRVSSAKDNEDAERAHRAQQQHRQRSRCRLVPWRGTTAAGGTGGIARDDRDKPQKPIRKSRATARDGESAAADVGHSPEESKGLLCDSGTGAPTVHVDADENGADAHQSTATLLAGSTGRSPSEQNAEEVSRASLMIVTDETNPSNDRSECNGPSYLLVTKRALSANEIFGGKSKQDDRPKVGLSGFIDSRFFGVTCAILMCLWFSSSTAFHALVSLPQRLSSNRHVSMSLAAVMEVGAFVLVYLVVSSRCGRRGPLCLAQILVGTACLGIAGLEHLDPALRWIVRAKTIVVVLGRIANIGSFFILRLVVIELFPTVSRGSGVGLCVGAEMIGGLLMPLIFKLNFFYLELPRIIIGIVCICTGLLVLIFPETLHTILPDSVADAKDLKQKGDSMQCNNEFEVTEQTENSEVLREKLFSDDWVEAGNGIIVSFTENKNSD